jgi:hypothetical protein
VMASWDKLADLNKGGFLVHRSNTENRNETEIRNTRFVGTSCKRHPSGDAKQYSAEGKIRIVLDGLRGEYTIVELCRCEGIAHELSQHVR